ncbi:hypothetical protein [Streptomyces sp. NBC_01451]|uniref:hypothetical protein n=1 Tax=Streptomyces sp. NBC_01451 TaxID=2903872 RepID=UPI002E346ECE|nr:hypothetical protein [Streptomyces sp. NBC_01451]
MTEEQRKPHAGGMGWATCLADPRWDANEFVQNVGYALIGLVPLKMLDLSGTGEAELLSRAKAAAKTITEKGDIFQFQKDQLKKGKSSGVLSALVEAAAVLALNTPDTGVTFFAFHACFWEHEGCPRDRDR